MATMPQLKVVRRVKVVKEAKEEGKTTTKASAVAPTTTTMVIGKEIEEAGTTEVVAAMMTEVAERMEDEIKEVAAAEGATGETTTATTIEMGGTAETVETEIEEIEGIETEGTGTEGTVEMVVDETAVLQVAPKLRARHLQVIQHSRLRMGMGHYPRQGTRPCLTVHHRQAMARYRQAFHLGRALHRQASLVLRLACQACLRQTSGLGLRQGQLLLVGDHPCQVHLHHGACLLHPELLVAHHQECQAPRQVVQVGHPLEHPEHQVSSHLRQELLHQLGSLLGLLEPQGRLRQAACLLQLVPHQAHVLHHQGPALHRQASKAHRRKAPGQPRLDSDLRLSGGPWQMELMVF